PAAVELPARGRERPDAPLVRAVQAYLDHRPDEAVELIRGFDPANQELLLYLLPQLVKLTEGGLGKAEPQELTLMAEQFQAALDLLQSRAALMIETMCYCRRVRKYGSYDPVEDGHAFAPGELVDLYVQLRNVSCEPAPGPAGGAGYLTRLRSTVE